MKQETPLYSPKKSNSSPQESIARPIASSLKKISPETNQEQAIPLHHSAKQQEGNGAEALNRVTESTQKQSPSPNKSRPADAPQAQQQETSLAAEITDKKAHEQAVLSKKEAFIKWIRDLLDFRKDKESDSVIIEQFRADVEFRGTKLWILICAILVASIGLNVNSTAVIIGAMLISPLMGPIIGFGLGLGIMDFELIKRALRNLVIATLFSILTATLYFIISPLSQPGSELLGRTHPTMYDVLIAFVGGAAGIIAGSTKSKGQVLPGVAIATALMPPLCTAGYGLASGQLNFFFGALYLFIINSVFIAFATYAVARLLKFPKKKFLDPQREIRIKRTIAFIAICTILPSIYLSSVLVRDSYRSERAANFVLKEMKFPGTQVIKKDLYKEGSVRILDVVLLGERITQAQIDSAQAKLPSYGLKDVRLTVHQGFEQEQADLGELRQAVLQDFYENAQATIAKQSREIDSLKMTIAGYDRYASLGSDINRELPVVFPSLKKARIVPSVEYLRGQDSVLLVLVNPVTPGGKMSATEKQKLSRWLSARTQAAKVRIIEDNN